jgi:L-2-hydroxyglutarate oxidase
MLFRMADVVVVGAGIVGLATAHHLAQAGLQPLVLDKEPACAAHQTGHNSGVIHSGLYYRPGSSKAINCVRGRRLLIRFCERHEVPFELCGKVVVATREEERPQLAKLHTRGLDNGVHCRPLSSGELREREPHVAPEAEGLWVADTGIVDYGAVSRALADEVHERGGEVLLGRRFVRAEGSPGGLTVVVRGPGGDERIAARRLVTCAGLQSDQVARACGIEPPVRVVPFRGEYGVLRASARHLCRHLIYPVPDPAFPFLGVHLTRTVHGDVECGPSAVLAFAREGYRLDVVDLPELGSTLAFRGLQRLMVRHWRTGLGELWRSLYWPAFVNALRRLVPELELTDVTPSDAGVRAQAVSADGAMVDDFVIVDGPMGVHVLNAPSPAATACLAIAETVAERVVAHGGRPRASLGVL